MSRLPVLFDGGCPMCRRTVRIIRALDWNDRLQFVDATNAEARAFFAPSLSEAEVMIEMYVIDERQRLHGGFEGYLQMARVVPLMWPFGVIVIQGCASGMLNVIVSPLGDVTYGTPLRLTCSLVRTLTVNSSLPICGGSCFTTTP